MLKYFTWSILVVIQGITLASDGATPGLSCVNDPEITHIQALHIQETSARLLKRLRDTMVDTTQEWEKKIQDMRWDETKESCETSMCLELLCCRLKTGYGSLYTSLHASRERLAHCIMEPALNTSELNKLIGGSTPSSSPLLQSIYHHYASLHTTLESIVLPMVQRLSSPGQEVLMNAFYGASFIMLEKELSASAHIDFPQSYIRIGSRSVTPPLLDPGENNTPPNTPTTP